MENKDEKPPLLIVILVVAVSIMGIGLVAYYDLQMRYAFLAVGMMGVATMQMLSNLLALPRLMIVGAYRGFLKGYSDWQEARYRERKWRTARDAHPVHVGSAPTRRSTSPGRGISIASVIMAI
jgi:hypothetical protein